MKMTRMMLKQVVLQHEQGRDGGSRPGPPDCRRERIVADAAAAGVRDPVRFYYDFYGAKAGQNRQMGMLYNQNTRMTRMILK